METCVRGFSFMPEKVEIMDLQYIESGELERTWKTSRRQRLKEQEQKIWEDFVKEYDVVKTLCKDDPYQFLNQLPESCLKELLETEYQKMKQQLAEEEEAAEQQKAAELQKTDDNFQNDGAIQHVVTFAEDGEKEDGDFFHIFDDENDKDDDVSGPEEEVLNDSLGSPSTVRERIDESNTSPVRQSEMSPDKDSKCSENVTNVIESSIYCAKVKDLRMKINEELLAIMASLERQEVASLPPEEVSRRCKRSTEFCTRFNRIYMYQLQRQMHDVKRNSNMTLPFAKHTQFQSQMIRIVSLHQNMLQAFQIFHKSFPQTSCLRASADALRALSQAARDASTLCRAAPAPKHFAAVADLYNDEVLVTCDKLDEAINDYSTRINDFLSSAEKTSASPSKKTVKNGKKRSFGSLSKSGSKSISETEARLSMYSLDTLRINLNPKSISSKDNQSSGTSKMRGPLSSVGDSCKLKENNEKAPKSQRKSPRSSHRPLMRDPQRGNTRAPRRVRDTDIRTMVEAVDTCTSSHVSREGSPRASVSGAPTPRRRSGQPSPRTPKTPRTKIITPRKSQNSTPRPKIRAVSPKAKERRSSPRTPSLKLAMSSIKTDPQDTIDTLQEQITPVSKIQCSQKDKKDVKEYGNDTKEECLSPHKVTSSRRSPRVHEDSTSERKSDREKSRASNIGPASCEVTRLLKQLCSGDNFGTRNERVSGAKNAQLYCVSGGSPRQPSTPQLLRILEETIQKKAPKPMYQKPSTVKDTEKYRLTFNISDKTTESLFQYRTKFVQHMLTSPLYANSTVGKPWEMIGSVSEKIIDKLLLECAKEMQLKDIIQELYKSETC